MRLRKKKNTVLALGAGGARGLAHIGVIRALVRDKVPMDNIVGVSFGAIVGALYSIFLDIDEVEKRLNDYMRSPVFEDTRRNIGIMENEKGRSFFENIQVSIKKGYFYTMAFRRRSVVTPEQFVLHMKELLCDYSFDDMKIPFKCLSVDLVTGNPIVFTEGDLCTALQASCASPGFFPPVELHGMMLVDGGVAEMVPFHLARTCRPDYIMGVDVTRSIEPVSDPSENLHHSLDMIFRSYDITREFMNVYTTRELDMVIRPDIGRFNWYDFEFFDEYVTEGYIAAKKKTARIRRDLFWF